MIGARTFVVVSRTSRVTNLLSESEVDTFIVSVIAMQEFIQIGAGN